MSIAILAVALAIANHLRDGSYERIESSQLPGLNDLNFDLLRRCILMAEIDMGEAIRTFRWEM